VWVETASAVPCRQGVHACRPADLSYWLAPCLWEVELEEPVVETRHKLTARRGRLLAQGDAYPAAVKELGAVCAWRARDRAAPAPLNAGAPSLASRFAAATTLTELRGLLGQTDDASFASTAAALAADTAQFALSGPLTAAPFIGACSAGHTEAGPVGGQADHDRGYAQEWASQSTWLVQNLGLAAD
jgi:hypothetical protein